MAVVKHLKPDRIGHGVRAAYNPDAVALLADTNTVLEICPTSNLHTRAVADFSDFDFILNTFDEGSVPFTINTDGTYLCDTNLHREFNIIGAAGFLSAERLERARQLAFERSFIPD
jgi:adenosine deaminase